MCKFIFLIVMVSSLVASAQLQTNSGFDKLLYTNEKDTLPYRLLKPENMQAQNKFPLVIFLHGAGERGTDNGVHIKHISQLFLNPKNRKKYPCFVLAPQCPQQIMWAAHDRDGSRLMMREKPTAPMSMVIELVDQIEREYAIDRSRIYVTGLSMGGYGTWDLIARFPQRFAAAVPICGGGDSATATRIGHVPIWAFHGALDEVVRPKNSRVMIKALQDAGANPGYTEYPDVGHDSWTLAYADPYLLPWLFDKHLAKEVKDK